MAVVVGLGGHSNHDDIGDLLDGLDDLDPPDLRPVVDDSLEHILENVDAYHEMWLTDEDDWDNLYNLNVKGTFFCCQKIAPFMIERGYGKIINLSSTWSKTSGRGKSAYSSSKAAVSQLTVNLSTEWLPKGIRVNAIAPGPFPTEGAWARLSPQTNDNNNLGEEGKSLQGNPLGRVGKMEELGNLATFLMSDGCDYLTGQTIAIDGGQYLTGGTFSHLSSLTDENWDAIKGSIKATNEKDKAKRSV